MPRFSPPIYTMPDRCKPIRGEPDLSQTTHALPFSRSFPAPCPPNAYPTAPLLCSPDPAPHFSQPFTQADPIRGTPFQSKTERSIPHQPFLPTFTQAAPRHHSAILCTSDQASPRRTFSHHLLAPGQPPPCPTNPGPTKPSLSPILFSPGRCSTCPDSPFLTSPIPAEPCFLPHLLPVPRLAEPTQS